MSFEKNNQPKILALYLPQFHRIRENDQWWGEGFTEWNVVKTAKNYSKYSIQPRVPINGYYDLSNYSCIADQAIMARKYGIDGFIIYSYYSNGKLLLEKPVELIYSHPEIDISYCFSWANHDWMRTWFQFNKEMLRKQEYGNNRKELEAHFNYMLPFFKDKRYIKINNKPLLIIYFYENIPNFYEYKSVWNEMAKYHGFDGIYFVQTLGGHGYKWDRDMFDACYNFEPTYTTFSRMQRQHQVNRIRRKVKEMFKAKFVPNYFDYQEVCSIIEKEYDADKNHWCGFFAEWDNTPRHHDNGTIYKHFSIQRFQSTLSKLVEWSARDHKPYIIINAWNEWGEGAFIEPDLVYGYQKLEAIKLALQ